MALLDDVKAQVRVTTTNAGIVAELTDLINAAEYDLKNTGINIDDLDDPLIKRAIILYCKAHFGYNNEDADRFAQNYDSLKSHLAMSVDYVV